MKQKIKNSFLLLNAAFFISFLLLSPGCKTYQRNRLPQADKPAKIPSTVKKIRFDLIVDTPFIFQNKLYLSAVGAPERDSYYNLLLEYDSKTKKQRLVATSSYFPGNIQKVKANNRWLVFCDGPPEVGPEKLIVVDFKKQKKRDSLRSKKWREQSAQSCRFFKFVPRLSCLLFK